MREIDSLNEFLRKLGFFNDIILVYQRSLAAPCALNTKVLRNYYVFVQQSSFSKSNKSAFATI